VRELWRGKTAVSDNADVARVKDAADIVRIVGEHVALRPKGREYVGLCPFHDDHKPSMNVVPSKGIFHCFVCGAGGDVLSFVQKYHKMEFREALTYLAERVGVTLTPRARGGSPDEPHSVSRADLLTATATATEFFRAILQHPEHGKEARAIIERRGISPAMTGQFLLGASPNRWDGLIVTMKSKNLPMAPFTDAGLVKKRENSDGAYDAFRNRLMFPIQDQVGRVIAFGARRIDDAEEPKYLNSPETRLFNKSATLYALNHASRSIQTERTAIITEGYTDVIACHQAGFSNVVATLGTALTREHAAALRRLCDRVVLLFDGDDAGQRAADRAVEVFFAEPLDVDIATLNRFTDAKDPDELLKREGGPEVFSRAISGAAGLLEYRFSRIRERLAGAGVAALSRAIEVEVAKLVELGLKNVPPVRQRLIVKRLASLVGLDEGTIMQAIPAGRAPRRSFAETAPTLNDEEEQEPAPETTLPLIQTASLTPSEHMLGCILCDGSLWSALQEEERDFIGPVAYRWPLLRLVSQTVHDLGEDGQTPDLSGVLRSVEDLAVKDAAVGLASRIDRETGPRLHAHWRACLNTARLDHSRPDRPQTPALQTSERPHEEQRADGQEAANAAIDQLHLKRKQHTSLGRDLRVLPRPN